MKISPTRGCPEGTHAGVVRLRVWPTTFEQTEEALLLLIQQIDAADLSGSLIIIDNQKIRIRKAPRCCPLSRAF
jgi:hypothetical protein